MYAYSLSGNFPAAFVIIAWLVVWASFFLIGSSKKSVRLPKEPVLVRCSIAVFVLIGVFHVIAFGVFGTPDWTNPFREMFQLDFFSLVGYISVLLGAILMILSRWSLRALSVGEVVFSKNKIRIVTGPYRIFRHPMYLGIFLVLIGVFFLFPTAFGTILFFPIAYCIARKISVEEFSDISR